MDGEKTYRVFEYCFSLNINAKWKNTNNCCATSAPSSLKRFFLRNIYVIIYGLTKSFLVFFVGIVLSKCNRYVSKRTQINSSWPYFYGQLSPYDKQYAGRYVPSEKLKYAVFVIERFKVNT